MRFPAAGIAAAWGAMNGLLVVLLALFGAKPGVIAIYAASAALIEVAALAFWLGQRRRARSPAWREAPNGDSVVLFAIGVIVAGLGWFVARPLALLALLPFACGVLREISLRRGKA